MCLPTSTAASALTTRIIRTVKRVVVQVSLLICLLTNLHLLSCVPVSFRRFYFLFTGNICSKSFLCVTFCGYHVRFFITWLLFSVYISKFWKFCRSFIIQIVVSLRGLSPHSKGICLLSSFQKCWPKDILSSEFSKVKLTPVSDACISSLE